MVTAELILVLTLALFFVYTNGFQDGSSVTASAIGCRALSPLQAILVASVAEFLGALFGGSAVAQSVIGITDWPAQPDLLPILASGLAVAILWNYLTKVLKLPSSSTHALFGGIIGAILAAAGPRYLVWGHPNAVFHSTGVWRVGLSLIISPLLGILLGYFLLLLANVALARATTRINRPIKRLQWLTVSALAFSHGANDGQKTMGVMYLALRAAGLLSSDAIPMWVRLSAATALSLGVASLAPGIVKRVGLQIYRLRPVHGLTAQLASAGIVLTTSITGGPVSTTQVISSSIMGVGTADRIKGVHWLAVKDVLLAWFLTIPCTTALAALMQMLFSRYL